MSLRSHPAVLRTIERARDIAERLIAVRIVETSIVLAAQAFLALFPLILVVAAVVPHDVSVSLLNELRSRYGLSGNSADALQSVLIDRGAVQQSLSVISFLLVIGSATAFTRALQRMYQNAWGLPKLGLRGLWRGFAWLIGLVAYLGILGTIAHVVHHGGVLAPVSTILGFGLWWWTPFLLLGGRVRARALIPAAVIITGFQLAAGLVSSAIVPRTIRTNEANYGPIGAVFAFESWLVIIMGLLVVGTMLGATIGLSDSRIGRWIRGTSDPDGWRREPKPVHVRIKRPILTDGAATIPGPTGAAGGSAGTGPAGPAGPAGPVEPVGPAGPVEPAGPAGPAGPVEPVGSVEAVEAVGSVEPVEPVEAVEAVGSVEPVGSVSDIGESQPADHASRVPAPVDPRASDDGRPPTGERAADQPRVDGRRTPT